MSDKTDRFWLVVGDNTNSMACGRIYSRDEAIAKAEEWAKRTPGIKYYVCETVTKSYKAKLTAEVK